MNRREIFFIAVLLLGWLSGLATAAVVETIDARQFDGTVVGLTASELTIQTAEGPKTISVRELANITFGKSPNPLEMSGKTLVLTYGGDVLFASHLRVETNRLTFLTGKENREMSFPLKQAKAILLSAPGQKPAEILRRSRAMKCAPGAHDIFVIDRKDGTSQKVVGTLTGMTEKKIIFTYRKKERAVARGRVRAIWLAKPVSLPVRSVGRLATKDGQIYAFSTITLSGKTFTLRRPMGQISLPRDVVGRISFHSDRLVSLADFKPTLVRQHGLFDKVFPYRKNRSAGGGPMRLGGREYDTGLGLHSFCELTYDLGGAYRTFIAVAGIDDAVRPNGNATLTILADGKAILPATTLTGRDAPQPLRLDVRGAKTLTIRVAFGPDKLDVADHVDLANARLVK